MTKREHLRRTKNKKAILSGRPFAMAMVTMALFNLSLEPLALAQSASSIDSLKDAKVDPAKPLIIDMKNPQWNLDPAAADSAILIIRDSKTNTTVKATLTESAKNSALFQGIFTINWKSEGAFQADIYSPPQEFTNNAKEQALESQIRKGRLTLRPYFLRSIGKDQYLTIFGSSEEALLAYAQFRNAPEKKPKSSNLQNIKTSDLTALTTLQTEVGQTEAVQKEFQNLETLADQQINKRKSTEEQLMAERAKNINEQIRLSELEKQTLIQRAKALSDEGILFYEKNQYKKAEEKFRESLKLVPLDSQYYLQYGVSLYRNKKYDEALAALALADGANVNPREKYYFVGLSHLKLKEFKPALANFALVTSVIDDSLTPSASFYTGLVYYTQEKYTLAKIAFEKTIDTSIDPQLDDRAESYIEKIASLMAFQEKRARPFSAILNTQLIYDSNIILISNASTGAGTDKEGFRLSLDASLDYNLLFQKSYDWAISTKYSNIFSMDDSFKPQETLQMADPGIISLSLPYRWKGAINKKSTLISVTPGYESLDLRLSTSQLPETIMTTAYLSLGTTLMWNEDSLSIFDLTGRSETAQVTSTSIVNAAKVNFSNTNLGYLNGPKTESYSWGWGVLMNQSKSDDLSFQRYNLNLGYTRPQFFNGLWSHRLTLADANYPDSQAGRHDTNYNYTTSWDLSFNKGWRFSLGAGYEANQSTVENFTYNKYLMNTGITWNGDF